LQFVLKKLILDLIMNDISAILPLLPKNTDISVAYAMQALFNGEATTEQQKKALNWIVEAGARTYLPSIGKNTDETLYNEGKRSVGLQIVQMVNANLSAIGEKLK
jgi:hypothetical protein